MRTTTAKEASIAGFFQDAPLAAANAVFGIIRATMKARNTKAAPAAPVKKKVRRPRKAKAVNVAVDPAQMSFAEAEPVGVE